MADHKVSRTLVKSAPELWAECCDAASLTRHLGAFGEIRITRLEPETAVAWEGDAVSGTVRLEPSGWGTRVVLSTTGTVSEARDAESGKPAKEAAVDRAEMKVDAKRREAPGGAKVGALGWLLGRLGLRGRPGTETSAEATEAGPPLERGATLEAAAALDAALDSLGRAHHRPYSRT